MEGCWPPAAPNLGLTSYRPCLSVFWPSQIRLHMAKHVRGAVKQLMSARVAWEASLRASLGPHVTPGLRRDISPLAPSIDLRQTETAVMGLQQSVVCRHDSG